MEPLEIVLNRTVYTPNYTEGFFHIGGASWASLEDAARKKKVMGKTSIPAGRYQVVPYVFFSRYEIRPLLKDVPDFTGIFIHAGNNELDSSGCILVGKNHGISGTLTNSRIGYAEVCSHICDAWAEKRDVFITVKDLEDHPWFDANI